jgi:hypothetical protein
VTRGFTVGFSAHRVETLAAAEAAMAGHAVVALEEPPTPGFAAMLAGRTSVADHLEAMAPEFPEFSRRQCELLRRLHRQGVEIQQVEPFMAELEAVHDLFDRGGRPDDLRRGTARWHVYQTEKQWTGALLDYYTAAAGDDFGRTVDAVCAFARADAVRGRLRDSMRARALLPLLTDGTTVYVEAGYVHTGLVAALRSVVRPGTQVRPRWLMAPVLRELSGRSLGLAPGDRLTLAFSRRRAPDPGLARLLAARSLIQVAMSIKEEMLPTADRPYPHACDDVRTRNLVDRLSLVDCQHLYPVIRSLPPPEVRAEVERHLAA